MPTGSVCTIHIICRTLAKSILSVRKQEKLRRDPAGWSSPACGEQGVLAPGPGRLLAAGAQQDSNVKPLLLRFISSSSLETQLGHLTRRLQLSQSREAPSSSHVSITAHSTCSPSSLPAPTSPSSCSFPSFLLSCPAFACSCFPDLSLAHCSSQSLYPSWTSSPILTALTPHPEFPQFQSPTLDLELAPHHLCTSLGPILPCASSFPTVLPPLLKHHSP